MNGCWCQRVIDGVALDEQYSVSLAHVVTSNAQLGVGGKGLHRNVNLIEILVSLHVIPLLKAVFPDFEEVAFSKGL